MACGRIHGNGRWLKSLMLLLACSLRGVNCEAASCREHEFLDHSGKCIPCQECGPGEELSKECGFGDQEDGQCLPCRPNRFKDDWGFQKCKPCQDCSLSNRSQKANCSATGNAACGDCLPGFYRKTKLGGFPDMECIPCGDPPPPYEPLCYTKVNLVKIPSTASSPRDTALAAVICSALSTVLLALLILCTIYCKRQFTEKKSPSWSSRSQDMAFKGSELSCFDRQRINSCTPRACHYCQRGEAPVQACGPVHMIPSLFCDEVCSLEQSRSCCSLESMLQDRHADSLREMMPTFLDSASRFSSREIAGCWPLMQTPSERDATSICEAHSEPTEDHLKHFSVRDEDSASRNIESDLGEGVELSRDLCPSEAAVDLENPREDTEYQDTSPPANEIENQSSQDCEGNAV